tara:strand:- start:140 stop:559 length:420 start_codon:yes stop_codon:yes gene_type:complete
MTDTENNDENPKPNDLDKKDTSSDKENNLSLSELEKTEKDESLENTQTEPMDNDEVRMASDLEPVYEIPVQVSAVLGKTRMQVSDLLKLGQGAVVELDRRVGEAIDIYVNNRLVARGEVVVVENKLGVTMTEIIKTEKS